MLLSLGGVRKVNHFEFIEQVSNLQISKNGLGTYRLTIANSNNLIIDDIKSYFLIEEDSKYIFVKVENKKGESIVLQINKTQTPKNLKKKKYLFYKNKEEDYIESVFDFIAYSKDGKFKYTSIYDSLEDTCFLCSVQISYNNLSKEDKLMIRKFFGFDFRNMLLDILKFS